MMSVFRFHIQRLFIGFGLILAFIASVIYIFLYDKRFDVRDRSILSNSVERNILLGRKIYQNENSATLACVRPNLPINDTELSKFYSKFDPVTCDHDEIWITMDGSKAQISNLMMEKHGKIGCIFTEILRVNDDESELGKESEMMYDSFVFVTDYYSVHCKAEDGKMWDSPLAGIRDDEDLQFDRKFSSLPSDSLALNVLMIGFDSLSRNHFIRALPKTYSFLTQEMESFILDGYNIVGDGTAQALIPMLTGKNELELPETRRRTGALASSVDVYPLIWKNFEDIGYVTFFGEDEPEINTFNYRMTGFLKQPTHHYMRTFYNYAYQTYRKHPSLCLRGTPRHKIFLDYLLNFSNFYSSNPKFAFAWYNEVSHDDFNLVAIADQDISDFLKGLKLGGHLENSIVIMLSDHGNRFSKIRSTQQGKQEERLPFVSIYLPPIFKQKHPSAADNVRINSGLLTTPYDIYETLNDVIHFSGAKLGSLKDRGISLFSRIPPSRSCSDAAIEPHWCACLTWEELPPTDENVVEASKALVHYINSYISSVNAYCHQLLLNNITSAALLLPNKGLLKFKETNDQDGFLPDLSAHTPVVSEVYQVSIVTKPVGKFDKSPLGLPKFEATLTYNIKQDSFSVKMADISRINKYGHQADCILNRESELWKFCYCRELRSD